MRTLNPIAKLERWKGRGNRRRRRAWQVYAFRGGYYVRLFVNGCLCDYEHFGETLTDAVNAVLKEAGK